MIDLNFTNWIKENVKELYSCQVNMGCEKQFKTKNSGHHLKRKPDYIFKTYNNQWGCIEFEQGETYGEITKGAIQLHDIYILCKNGLYFECNNIKIIPHFFFLATTYSSQGRLYKNDTRIIQTGGYSNEEKLNENNNTIFHATRWLWRFGGRDNNLFSQTNPIGCNQFSVIYSNYKKKPEVQLFGNKKLELGEL